MNGLNMEKIDIIKSITERTGGDLYLGVVGAVRTGKSTFIKKVIETLVVPNIDNENNKKICLDEIPQSSNGKAIMTTEPKFVPSNGANIKIDEIETNIKLIDCVGYVVDGASGFQDELGNPRLVKTPWYEEEIPFENGDYIFIPEIRKAIEDKKSEIPAFVVRDGKLNPFTLKMGDITDDERKIILAGCLINFYAE